jgi:hypothetical protein
LLLRRFDCFSQAANQALLDKILQIDGGATMDDLIAETLIEDAHGQQASRRQWRS